MIRDLPSSRQPAWRLIAQEAAAFAAAGLLMPFGIRSSRRRTPRARDQRTGVLVHGYLANRSTISPSVLRLIGDTLAEPILGVGEGALQGRAAAAQRAEGERRRAPASPAHRPA